MPFKSEKQRKWMHANEPEMAKKWEKEEKNEGNIGITTKKGKTIELTHKTSGKEIVVVNNPSVLKKYKKLGYLISMPEGIVSGGVKSGGTEAGLDVVRAMTRGNNSRVGNLSNMSNWIGQYKDGIEFGLKKKMKVDGKVVSIVQIKVTGKDKYTIAYLDWDDGKRPLLTRKIHKNVSGKNLPKELKKSVKVG